MPAWKRVGEWEGVPCAGVGSRGPGSGSPCVHEANIQVCLPAQTPGFPRCGDTCASLRHVSRDPSLSGRKASESFQCGSVSGLSSSVPFVFGFVFVASAPSHPHCSRPAPHRPPAPGLAQRSMCSRCPCQRAQRHAGPSVVSGQPGGPSGTCAGSGPPSCPSGPSRTDVTPGDWLQLVGISLEVPPHPHLSQGSHVHYRDSGTITGSLRLSGHCPPQFSDMSLALAPEEAPAGALAGAQQCGPSGSLASLRTPGRGQLPAGGCASATLWPVLGERRGCRSLEGEHSKSVLASGWV